MKILTRCRRSAAVGRYGISRIQIGPIRWSARIPPRSRVRTRTRLGFLPSSCPKLGSLRFSCSRICISTPTRNLARHREDSIFLWLAWQGDFALGHGSAFAAAGYYWHFVDIVWVFVLFTVYILPLLR